MKGFQEDQVLFPGEVEQLFCLSCVGRGWLLEQDMFARLEGLLCPLIMKTIWKGIVDAVDVGVVDQGII